MSAPTLELLAAEMAHLREVQTLLEGFRKERDAWRESALILQAAEYERRMTVLNHATERMNAAAAHSVSRDTYEADRKGDAAQAQNTLARVQEAKDEIMKMRQELSEAIGLLRVEGVAEPLGRLQQTQTRREGMVWQAVTMAAGWVVALALLLLSVLMSRGL